MSELPQGWARAKLSEIAVPDRPRELPQNHPASPFIGMEHIEAQTMRLLGTVPASEFKSSAVQFLMGDVLYGRLRPYLNKVHVTQFEGLCSAEFIVFAKRKDLNSSWLAYRLNSTDFVSFASSLNAGDRPRVDFDQIGQFDLLVAPRGEQDRIVDEIEKQLSRLDAATAALKRVLVNLKRYRASVLKAACEGRLVPIEAELARREGREYEPADKLLERILRERRARWEADTVAKMIASGKPPKDERWKQRYKEPLTPDLGKLAKLPEGWCWTVADQICSQVTDGEHIQPPYTASGLPMLTAKHVQDGYVDFNEFGLISEEHFAKARARCAPSENDVLIVSVGATTGRTGIVRHEDPFAIVRSVLLLRPLINPTYLLSWVQSPLCQDWIGYASGSTAQAHFYIGDARRMPVAFPPEEEQKRIATKRDEMLSAMEVLVSSISKSSKISQGLRTSILKTAFAGGLVGQDPGDEPATALLERIQAERSVSRPTTAARRRKQELVHA